MSFDPGLNVLGSDGGGGGTSTNTGRTFITLKPQEQRKDTAEQIMTGEPMKLLLLPLMRGTTNCSHGASEIGTPLSGGPIRWTWTA